MGVNQPILRKLEYFGTYFVCYTNQALGIISGKVPNHFGLVVVREDHCDQRNALIRGDSIADQLFPGWIFTVRERVVNFTKV